MHATLKGNRAHNVTAAMTIQLTINARCQHDPASTFQLPICAGLVGRMLLCARRYPASQPPQLLARFWSTFCDAPDTNTVRQLTCDTRRLCKRSAYSALDCPGRDLARIPYHRARMRILAVECHKAFWIYHHGQDHAFEMEACVDRTARTNWAHTSPGQPAGNTPPAPLFHTA
eukprot:649393-Prymnesium_polylepis.1